MIPARENKKTILFPIIPSLFLPFLTFKSVRSAQEGRAKELQYNNGFIPTLSALFLPRYDTRQ